MKTYLKYILAPTVLAFSLTGCFDLATPGSDTDESIKATHDASVARQAMNIGCDFEGRKTVDQIQNAKGIIMMIGEAQTRESATFAIHVPETNQRYTVCKLPDHMMRQGTTVRFSGNQKEIFPNERWMATPFELKTIEIIHPIR